MKISYAMVLLVSIFSTTFCMGDQENTAPIRFTQAFPQTKKLFAQAKRPEHAFLTAQTILGLQPEASTADLRKAYLRARKRFEQELGSQNPQERAAAQKGLAVLAVIEKHIGYYEEGERFEKEYKYLKLLQDLQNKNEQLGTKSIRLLEQNFGLIRKADLLKPEFLPGYDPEEFAQAFPLASQKLAVAPYLVDAWLLGIEQATPSQKEIKKAYTQAKAKFEKQLKSCNRHEATIAKKALPVLHSLATSMISYRQFEEFTENVEQAINKKYGSIHDLNRELRRVIEENFDLKLEGR